MKEQLLPHFESKSVNQADHYDLYSLMTEVEVVLQ